jgi:hypothetical protein
VRKVALCVLLCLLLSACSKEEPVETEAVIPTVSHVDNLQTSFTCWGDEVLLELEGDEVFAYANETQAKVLPDVYTSDGVVIDYIQGVSLNDFGYTYWYALDDSTKSEYDNGFTTDTDCYKFVRTEKNSFIMIHGPLSTQKLVDNIYNRLNVEEDLE